MNIRKIIWFSIAFVSAIIFWSVIPIDVYAQHNILYSFIGGVILFVALFMGSGDFHSISEITEKKGKLTEESTGKKVAPFMVIPALIFVFVLLFHSFSRKRQEIDANGVLTIGTVVDGEVTETTRRIQTSTSYSIVVQYKDSLGSSHTIDETVSRSEFDDVYKGAEVDVVYSRRLPGLAKVVFDTKELTKYKDIADEKINIDHLLPILDGSIKSDSVLQYLNTISYKWTTEDNSGFYNNERQDIALKVFPEGGELAYVERGNMYVANTSGSFESEITNHGFKKKASMVNGKSEMYYYNDDYIITREQKASKDQGKLTLMPTTYLIYHIMKKESDN